MALDKLVDSSQLDGALEHTADAIRAKTGDSGSLEWDMDYGFSVAVGDIISLVDMPDVTFANTATSGKTYTDISSSAPVLVAGDYLYINEGYIGDKKISLAKLVPDGSDVKGHNEYILSGHSAYDNDGTLVAGSILTLASKDLVVNGKTVTVPLGKYTGTAGATPVSASIAEGSYSASILTHSVDINPVVTGSISGTITDIGTTTKPSGDDGTDYWTISPTGSVAVTGISKAKGQATINTAGYLTTGNKVSIESAVNIVPNVATGSARYIPKAIVTGSSTNATATTTVAPGTVSISKQSTPSGVTNAASGNATTTAPSSGVYVAVKATAAANSTGTTSSISGSGYTTVTSAGYAPSTLSGSISVSGTATAKTSAKDSSMTYIPITTAAPVFDGGTLSGGSTATGTNITLSETDNGIKIQTAYSANRTAVLYNGAVAGWVDKADDTEALAADSLSSTNGTAYYVTDVTVPKDIGFGVITTADTALDTTSDLDITNNAYRRVDISNKEHGKVVIANRGNVEVTSDSSTIGNLTVSAYDSSGTPRGNKSIVSNGKWVEPTVNAGDTYYGRVVVASGEYAALVSRHTVTTSPTVTGIIHGTVTDIGTATQPSGTDGTDYWTIVPSGTSTRGVSTAKAKAVVGVAGYITAGEIESSETTVEIRTNVINGDSRYIPKAVIAGSSTDATATTTVAPGTVSVSKQDVPSGVTQAASGNATTTAPSSGVYVAVKATAAANSTGTTSAISGSGSATVTTAGYAPSNLTGSISVSGTATAKTSAKDSSVTYVPITTATPEFIGGAMSGTATASASNANLSESSNTSGVSITTACTVTRSNLYYDGAVEGWVSKEDLDLAYESSSAVMASKTYYIDNINIPANKTFSMTCAGTTSWSPTASSVGILKVYGYNGSTSEGPKTIVNNGKWVTTSVNSAGTYYGKVTVASGTITNNTSGGTSSGTINRGSQIKIGKGYYASDSYYTAQENNGNLTIAHSGTTSVDGYASISVPSTGITEGTTTVSGTTATRGTATWNDGWIDAGTMSVATFANSATSGTTYVDISSTTAAPVLVAGNYLYINKGYTDNLKISLAKLVPDGSDVKGHGEYLLSGHSAYDNDGTLVAGTIPTIVSTDLEVSGKTVTVPVGKYTGASGATAVSASVADGSYSASVSSHSVTTTPVVTGSISGTVTDIGTTTKPSSGTDGTDYWTITPSGSVTTTGVSTAKGKATIGTAGYITTGNKESSANTVNITPTVTNGAARYLVKATIAGSSTNATATTTVAPGTVSISKQDVPSGVTQAASGNATTTAPSSGVYVAVKATAAANTTGTTSAISGSGSASVTTAGYAPTTLTGSVTVSGTATAKTSAKDSSVTYVPIKTGSATTPATSITANPSISVNSSGLITATVSGSQSVTPTVSAGYVLSGTAGTVSVSGSKTSQLTTQAAKTWTPTTTNQTIATGTYLTGAQTIIGDTNLIAENIRTGATIFGIAGTYTGIAPVVVETTDSHGGTIVDITTDAEYSWRGPAVELLDDIVIPDLDITMKDTSYNTWTPTETNTLIQAYSTATTFVADMLNYEYFIEWKCWMDYVYNTGTEFKLLTDVQCDYIINFLHRYPSSFTMVDNNNYNASTNSYYSSFTKRYYNASGVQSYSTDGSYAIRANIQSSSGISNTTANNPTITVRYPGLYARCHSTYFPAAAANALDKTNSIYHIRGKVYRTRLGDFGRGMRTAATNLYKERSSLL